MARTDRLRRDPRAVLGTFRSQERINAGADPVYVGIAPDGTVFICDEQDSRCIGELLDTAYPEEPCTVLVDYVPSVWEFRE